MDLASRLADLTRPTGEEDLLAVKYPKPRLSIDPKHGLWVAVSCVVALVGWLLLRDAPTTDYTYTATVTSSPPAPSTVVVSVVGEVARPGLVTLAPDARVDAALQAAGLLPSADLVALNLAEKVVDGKQIVVPAIGAAPPVTAGTELGKISLNSATAADLEQLDGVGAKTAAAIIKHRDQIGGFTSAEQLQDVKGIGPAKYAAIAPDVTL